MRSGVEDRYRINAVKRGEIKSLLHTEISGEGDAVISSEREGGDSGRRLCEEGKCQRLTTGGIASPSSHAKEKKMNKFMQFLREEEGATAVEYGLMVALIAAVIVVGAGLLGTNTNATFNGVAGVVAGAGPVP